MRRFSIRIFRLKEFKSRPFKIFPDISSNYLFKVNNPDISRGTLKKTDSEITCVNYHLKSGQVTNACYTTKTPQNCCKLLILSTCFKMFQQVDSLFNFIKIQQVC